MSMNKPPRVWVSNEKPKAGDILRVRAQMEHVMETGLRNDPATSKPRPRHIMNHFEAKLGGKLIFTWDPGTSIAQNPYIEFTFKARQSGELTMLWKDDQGQTLTATRRKTHALQYWPLPVAGAQVAHLKHGRGRRDGRAAAGGPHCGWCGGPCGGKSGKRFHRRPW